jgi:hypothetical protein
LTFFFNEIMPGEANQNSESVNQSVSQSASQSVSQSAGQPGFGFYSRVDTSNRSRSYCIVLMTIRHSLASSYPWDDLPISR